MTPASPVRPTELEKLKLPLPRPLPTEGELTSLKNNHSLSLRWEEGALGQEVKFSLKKNDELPN